MKIVLMANEKRITGRFVRSTDRVVSKQQRREGEESDGDGENDMAIVFK